VPARASKLVWTGLALVMPAAVFWAVILVSAATQQQSLAKPFLDLVKVLHVWFVLGVLLLMPLLGGILAALGFHRRHMALAVIVMVLGFGAAFLNVLMQTTPQPVH
jgi:hypothetical protein